MMLDALADISVLGGQPEPAQPIERLVVAARLGDLDGLDPAEPGLAVFLTDWIDWLAWRRQGGLAVHAESCLAEWPQELGEQARFVQQATSWMYVDGRDVTLFKGVSLGKQLNWEATGVCLAFGRLYASLTRAVKRLAPQRIEYRNLRAEYDFLSGETALNLVRDVAAACAVPFSAQAVATSSGLDHEKPFDGEFAPVPLSRRLTLRLIELATDALSRLSGLFKPRSPRVFILHNLLVVQSLLEYLPAGKVAPVLLAGIHPKRPAFLLPAWRQGARLLALPSVRPDNAARHRLMEINDAIKGICQQTAPTPWEQAVLDFLRRQLCKPGLLEGKARQILQFHSLFASERPSRILVGDSENHLVRLACEVAQSLGVGVDELPNGMFLTAQRMDSRSGDAFRKPVIDRFLAWGASGMRWAQKAAVGVPAVETGYPVADSLICKPAPSQPSAGRALILPLHVDKTDLCGLYSEVFVNLIRTVRAARAAGFKDIRIKVHPGFIQLDYYKELTRRFALQADVFKDGPLLPHIAWADIVIGPVNSGAMIETAALGRPYISVLNPPTAIESDLAFPARPILSQDLPLALEQARFEDGRALLADIAGYKPGHAAGQRVWKAVLSAIDGDMAA